MDKGIVTDVLDLWHGKEFSMELEHAIRMGGVADRFQMTEVAEVLDEIILSHLSVEVCADVLSGSSRMGLERVANKARTMAIDCFEEVSSTKGFLNIDEENLGIMIESNRLVVSKEEIVLESLVRWMEAESSRLHVRELLGEIRYPLMSEEYLGSKIEEVVPAEHLEWVKAKVDEAVRAKAVLAGGGSVLDLRLLGPKAVLPRSEKGLRWENMEEVYPVFILNSYVFLSVVICKGKMCLLSSCGTILTRDLELGNSYASADERVIYSVEDDNADDQEIPNVKENQATVLVEWAGTLISGHDSGELRVWDVLTDRCEQVLRGGGKRRCCALAVAGSRLLDGRSDGSILVWVGAATPWRHETTLLGHAGRVAALASWRGKAISGSRDRTVRVWDLGTGAQDAVLASHGGAVTAVLAHGDRLFSASTDGAIRVWAAGTWALLRTVGVDVEVHELHDIAREAGCRGLDSERGPDSEYGSDSDSDSECSTYPKCLAVSGTMLVSGSVESKWLDRLKPPRPSGQHRALRRRLPRKTQPAWYLLRAWDLESPEFDCRHTLMMKEPVHGLLARPGELWVLEGKGVQVHL